MNDGLHEVCRALGRRVCRNPPGKTLCSGRAAVLSRKGIGLRSLASSSHVSRERAFARGLHDSTYGDRPCTVPISRLGTAKPVLAIAPDISRDVRSLFLGRNCFFRRNNQSRGAIMKAARTFASTPTRPNPAARRVFSVEKIARVLSASLARHSYRGAQVAKHILVAGARIDNTFQKLGAKLFRKHPQVISRSSRGGHQTHVATLRDAAVLSSSVQLQSDRDMKAAVLFPKIAGVLRSLAQARRSSSQYTGRLVRHMIGCGLVFAVFTELRARTREDVTLKKVLESRQRWRESVLEIQAPSVATPVASGIAQDSAKRHGASAVGCVPSEALPPLVFIPGMKGSELTGGAWTSAGMKMMLRCFLPGKNTEVLSASCEWDPTTGIQKLTAEKGRSTSFFGSNSDVPWEKPSGKLLGRFRLFDFFTIHPGQALLERYFERVSDIEKRPYYVFTYDWRRSPIEIAVQLDAYLDEISERNGGQKPQVLAHSFGGLIFWYLLIAKDISYPFGNVKTRESDTIDQLPSKSTSSHRREEVDGVCALPDECYAVIEYKNGEKNVLEPPIQGTEHARANHTKEQRRPIDRFDSILFVAPPVQMTPYFLFDMIHTDPDYMAHGSCYSTFTSSYTFFPDNVYNVPGRCLKRIDLLSGSTSASAGAEKTEDQLQSHRHYTDVAAVHEVFAGEGFLSSNVRRVFHDFEATSGNSHLAFVLAKISHLVLWVRNRSFFHSSEVMMPEKSHTDIMSSIFTDFREGKGPVGDEDLMEEEMIEEEEPVEAQPLGASTKKSSCEAQNASRGDYVCFDWMSPKTWLEDLPVKNVFDKQHLEFALSHSELFWRRIAEGTYGTKNTREFEHQISLLNLDHVTEADFSRINAMSASRTCVIPRDDHFPPVALLLGDVQPTGEQVVAVARENAAERSPSYHFDGCNPQLKVPGDGRLPAGRLWPRGSIFSELLKDDNTDAIHHRIYRSLLSHSRMLNDIEVVDAALRDLTSRHIFQHG